jgi:chromosome segregation ATPase
MSRFRGKPLEDQDLGQSVGLALGEQRQRLADLAAEAERAERAAEALRRGEREALMRMGDELAAARDEAVGELEAVAAERDRLAARVAKVTREHEALEASVEQRNREQQEKLEAHLARAGQAMLELRAELEQELTRIREELQSVERAHGEAIAERDRLAEQLTAREADIEATAALARRIDGLEHERDEATWRFSRLKVRHAELQADLDAEREELAQLVAQFSRTLDRHVR